MKHFLDWQISKSIDGKVFDDFFPASVPGNAQLDYAKAKGFAKDWFVGNNFHKFDGLENNFWKYQTTIPEISVKKSEQLYFISHGIDYQFEVILNGVKIYEHEGMFTLTKIPLLNAKKGDVLEVLIYPAPKNPVENGDMLDESRIPLARSEADRSAKPAVCYGWDFHPRLIVQGIWDETYLETVNDTHIISVDVNYEIKDIKGDIGVANVNIACERSGGTPEYTILDEKGVTVYQTNENNFSIPVMLWFPHNLGKQPVYTLYTTLKNKFGDVTDEICEKIGFKKIELLMNEGAWKLPERYPMTRSFCPFTICINGQTTFGQGSNFVNLDVFVGTLTEDDYHKQLMLVKQCNMNIIRLWGGAVVNKNVFFDICDQLGIMVWQEFPLACNNYVDDKHYLKIIDQESKAIIRKIKNHPCHILWCGGNELFNHWSLMTDQSLVLRTLNKNCLELDPYKPFMPTSPIMGVTHGPYRFTMYGQDVFHLFNDSISTGYTEFGIPSMTNYEQLAKFIPKDELDCFKNTLSWKEHHAFDELNDTAGHCDYASVTKYFGVTTDTKKYVELSQFLACVGYTYIFEEARRQPMCSMAINWCFNEPWYCAANNSLVSYDNNLKPSYYAVQKALAPITPSMRMKKFDYSEGECVEFEIHLLNNTGRKSNIDKVDVYIDYGNKSEYVSSFNCNDTGKNELLGKIDFTIDEKILSAKGIIDSPNKNTVVAIVLQANGIEKKYPFIVIK